MRPLEVIAIILLGLCALAVIALFAFYPFPKAKMENVSIFSMQSYDIINAFGKPQTEYEIGFISKTGTAFHVTIREIHPASISEDSVQNEPDSAYTDSNPSGY